MPPPHGHEPPESSPHPHRDPRLEIPEELRTPIRKPDYDPLYGDKKSRSDAADLKGMGRAWAVALNFVFTIIVGAGLGYLADRWRHSPPLWTLVGLGIGFVAAFIQIVRATQQEERRGRGG